MLITVSLPVTLSRGREEEEENTTNVKATFTNHNWHYLKVEHFFLALQELQLH